MTFGMLVQYSYQLSYEVACEQFLGLMCSRERMMSEIQFISQPHFTKVSFSQFYIGSYVCFDFAGGICCYIIKTSFKSTLALKLCKFRGVVSGRLSKGSSVLQTVDLNLGY